MKPQDIRALRTAYGLTREQFSKSLNLSKQTLYFWEKGKHKPSRYDLVVLYKLWAMLHNSNKRKVAEKALNDSVFLENISHKNVGTFINGGLEKTNLGNLLSEIFKEKNE